MVTIDLAVDQADDPALRVGGGGHQGRRGDGAGDRQGLEGSEH